MKSRVSQARLAVLPLACAAAFPVLAQSIATLPETVVTATRTARTADELMQSVDVLTRQDIELLAPASVMDLIGSVPGVMVTRSGGPGKSVGVYLRGANSDHVLVLVNGVRVPLAGRVSMDMITVDLGDVPATIGDHCVLWGEGLPADEVAAASGTISYELFCKVTARVQRILA